MHKIKGLLLIFFLAMGFSCLAQFTKSSVNYPYLVYLPDNYSQSRQAMPLLIYLHGASIRGQNLERLKEYGVPFYLEHGNKVNCIVVAPQCPENKYWSTDNWFDSLFADLCHKYRIDKSRIYLTGISMGGYGTWQLAVEHPEIFAAIVPLCGGCNDSARICQIRNIPVWTCHGEEDDRVPISETEGLVRTLTACKGDVKFTRIPNQGHAIQYLYLNNDIYDWLLTKRKK